MPLKLTATAAVRADHLEIQLRQHLFQLVQQAITLPDSGSDIDIKPLGDFWRSSLELCVHLVYFSEHDNGSDERYRGMDNRGRKLPLALLEDALDTLPVQQCQQLWELHVEPAYEVLFSPLLWTPASSTASKNSHPCWLPFITNKFLRRLQGGLAARLMLTLAKYPYRKVRHVVLSRGYARLKPAKVEEQQRRRLFRLQQQLRRTMGKTVHSGPHFLRILWSLQHDFSNRPKYPSRIS
jgi:hypothetical protein